MKKYHITKDGRVAECTATVRSCPLGGPSEHFKTRQRAQDHLDKLNADEFGFLPAEDGSDAIVSIRSFDRTMSNRLALANQVYRASDVNARGFDYECYAASEYAQSLGLDAAIVINDDGSYEVIGELEDPEKTIEYVNSRLGTFYNINIEEKNNPSRVIYAKDGVDNYVAQLGSPQMLDAAIITNDNIDVAEVKKGHEEGAQLKMKQLTVNEKGFIESEHAIPEVAKALEKVNIEDAMGTNTPIEVDDFVALEHFVQSYKDAGATKFVYTNQEGKAVIMDISDDIDTAVYKVYASGIKVDLSLRSNITERYIREEDKERLKNTNKTFFKSGKTPTSDFRFGDIDKSKISKRKGKIQIGEMTLPLDYDDRRRIPDDTIIEYDKVKVSPLYLTGTIKSSK